MILEARYEKLYQEYSEDRDYFKQVEPALQEAYASLRWHENAIARYKVKNKELQVRLSCFIPPHWFVADHLS